MPKTATIGAILVTLLVHTAPVRSSATSGPALAAGPGDALSRLMQLDTVECPLPGGLAAQAQAARRGYNPMALRIARFLFQVPTSATVADDPARWACNWRFFRDCATGSDLAATLPSDVGQPGLTDWPNSPADRWRPSTTVVERIAILSTPSLPAAWSLDSEPQLDPSASDTIYRTVSGLTTRIGAGQRALGGFGRT